MGQANVTLEQRTRRSWSWKETRIWPSPSRSSDVGRIREQMSPAT